MWSFVPAVALLIGTIFGNCEMNNNRLYIAESGDENNDAWIDDQDGKTSMDVLEAWKEKEPLIIGEMYEKQIARNRGATDGQRRNEYLDDTENPGNNRRINLLANTVSKRKEVEPWFDLPRESEELQDPSPSSQKKKKKKKKKTTTTTTTTNPWIYRWENRKRQSTYGASSEIRRPIRVPFNSWGGKRGKGYSRSAMIFFPVKRAKLTMQDLYDPEVVIDGYDVKRQATDMDKAKWKIPFNSWGGKRAEKLTDRGRYLRYLMERDNAPVLGVIKGYEFAEEKDDENNDEKENDIFLRRIPFPVYNKTNEHDSSMINQVNERFPLMASKRIDSHEICKRKNFDPWGGKRSLDTYPVRSGKKIALRAYSSQGKIFLCCSRVEQPK